MIIPSHDLVVVWIGHSRGQGPGVESFRKALETLMQAIPPSLTSRPTTPS